MKRPNKLGGSHRAKPPQANTAITAAIILTIILLCALVIWAICATHKLAGGANGNPPNLSHPVVSSSPLGGGDSATAGQPRVKRDKPTTHILHEEPLEGGGGLRETESSKLKLLQDTAVTAPQRRDRPAIEMMQSEVVEAKAARERRIAVWRIDTYLAHKGSPMQGCGEYYIQNQERTGIPGSLSAGIAEAESTNGMRCYNGAWSHNAWGMIGPEYRGGFASWEEGITANFNFLMRWHGPGAGKPIPQTIHDCSGYCEGNTTNQTVDDVQWQINAYEPPEGK